MRSLTGRAFIGAAALIVFGSTALAVDYGRTAGAFSVSGGVARYTIPIWTPPGPNGLTPSISLSYASGSGNGVGGVGWHISAVSSIERCARTIGQDGGDAAVDLTLADRFCIGGNRLRLYSGTYGVANSVYMTEIADYSRITAYGTAGGGPQYFIVEAKSGLKYEYGNTTDSRVNPGVSPGAISNTPSRWMLNKVYDRNGNNYIITYLTSGGFARPDSIYWTPTYLGSSSYRYEAKFNYSNPRTDADSVFGKIAGFDVANKYRLENVQIKSAGTVVRKYRLGFDTSSVTSRSRLTSAKECADDAESNCFLPITFTYQTGQSGVTVGASTPPSGSSNSLLKGRYDFNGDGKHDIAYWGGSSWQVVLATNSGFAGPYNTGATAASAIVDDFLPTGRAALMTSNSGVLYTYRWDDASSSFVSFNTGISSVLPTTSLDMSGDGMADLVYHISGSNCLQARWNTSTGSGNPSFSSSAFGTACLASPRVYASLYPYSSIGKGLYRGDVNGDGRQDLNAHIVYTGMGGGATAAMILLGSNAGLDITTEIPGGAPNWPFVNFNGDRCTDRQVGSTIQVSACAGATANAVTIPASPSALYDWDGDGKTDAITASGVYRSTGIGFSGLISTSAPTTGFDVDLDGDGQDDFVTPNAASAAFSYWTHTASGSVPTFATNIPDLLNAVTDGFGVNQTVNYVSTAWGSYDKGATTSAPLQESDPDLVVAQVTSSNGIGGTFNRTYFYVGARTNGKRGESAGFQRVDETDGRNGVISRAYFEQAFPVVGMVYQQETMQPGGVIPMSRTVVTNNSAALDVTVNNERYFPYPQQTTATRYEVQGSLDGNLLQTAIATNSFDSASGALYDQTVATIEPAAGANGVNAGGTWYARTYLPLASLINDTANWCLGRPQRIEQTNSHNLTYGTSILRATDVAWDNTKCRPTQSTDEPGSSTLQVITGIGYDTFGNVSSTTVTGIGMTARSNSTVYSDATHQTGQFPLSQTNALSQATTGVWNYDLGVPMSVTDPNNLSISFQYDAFGRRIQEYRPDSTYTTWDYTSCVPCDPRVRFLVDRNDRAAGGVAYHRSLQFIDQLDRSIYEYDLRTDGNYNVATRDYDALGRLARTYFPYVNTTSSPGFASYSYDLANRLKQIARPISDSNSTLTYTAINYQGLTTETVDGQSKVAQQVKSAAGLVARTIDHSGYAIGFEYDAFGGVKRVFDSSSNTLQSSNYNIRGMLTSRTDMEMGGWGFTPNALGETVSQIDAKSQTTTFGFDLLGRLITRSESEGTSTWTWGNSASAKNIGQLASLSGPGGYAESYVYDSIGRPSSTSITADTSYQISYSYNNLGKLDTLTYPASTGSLPLQIKHLYQSGALYRIQECTNASCTTTGTNYWTMNAANARSQVTQETLGNNLVTNRGIDAITGWLKSIQSGVGGGAGVQDLAYEWDLVGNLKKRKDVNQSNLTEEFFYDNLYRLDYSTLNASTNLDLSYDALGNITSKTGVGTYGYHATKKHQVTSTSNGWSFGYDANGNMTDGRGAYTSWTSYNYPLCIRTGADCTGTAGNWSKFSYTPGRQYWKQEANFTSGGGATTIYIGGLVEKVSTSAGTDYKHFIRAGGATVVVSRQSGGTNSTHYVTTDHLGSSSAITNASGGILINSSFDAFGGRRGAGWTGSPSAGDWTAIASTTRRGFTDHSMLDNLGLIHMGGRMLDPVIGRAMSADPFVTYPERTQSFNRYSYSQNNPLSRFDPNGFNDADAYFALQNEDVDPYGSMMQFLSFATGQSRDLSASSYSTGLEQTQQQFLGGFRGSEGALFLPSAREIVEDAERRRLNSSVSVQDCDQRTDGCQNASEAAMAEQAGSALGTAANYLVPGWHSFNTADWYCRSGRWGWCVAYNLLGGAEVGLAMATFGASNAAQSARQASVVVATDASQAARGADLVVGSGAREGVITVARDTLAGTPNVIGRIQALPFRSGSMRSVSLEGLPFTELSPLAFREAARVLGPGGRLTGSTGRAADLGAIRRGLEQAGFRDIQVQYGLGDAAGNYRVIFSGVGP